MQRRAALAALAGLVCWKVQDRAFLTEESDLKDALTKVVKPWKQPHRLHLSSGGLHLTGVAQGADQYDLALSEGAGDFQPAILLSKLGGNTTWLGFQYDSDRSKYQLPRIQGLKHVSVNGAGTSDLSTYDWTVQLDGAEQHLTVTGNEDNIAYDASLGAEVPVPRAKGLSALYAVDVKHEGGSEGFAPSSIRHGAGLRYTTPVGDAKVILHQTDPRKSSTGVDLEATLSGKLEGTGSPKYVLRAQKDFDEPAAYTGRVLLTGPQGVSGGLQLQLEDTTPSLAGYAEVERSAKVGQGLEVSAKTRVVATPLEKENKVALQPLAVHAKADLATFLPSVVNPGSSLDVAASYKLGAERATVAGKLELSSSKIVPLAVKAEGLIDDKGKAFGSVRVAADGPQVIGGRYGYEAVYSEEKGLRQVGEVSFPLPSKQISATAYGRVTKSEKDHDGKPRLQLGLQYDFDASVAGQSVSVGGNSGLYDAGSTLIRSDGLLETNLRLERARKTAELVRKRVGWESGPGHQWLRK